MSNKAKPDEYAYPSEFGATRKGMTLRQWYAGMALQGMLSAHPEHLHSYETGAEVAFRIADAMIAAETV